MNIQELAIKAGFVVKPNEENPDYYKVSGDALALALFAESILNDSCGAIMAMNPVRRTWSIGG
jgi:hypothetical protein